MKKLTILGMFSFLLVLFSLPTINATWCYQETANVSTACGGIDSGSYSIEPNYVYVNYTKPINALSTSRWQIKHGTLSVYNVSLPINCFNQDRLRLRFYTNANFFGYPITGSSYGQCFDGIDWITISLISSTYTGSGLASGINIQTSTMYDGDWNTFSGWVYNNQIWDSTYLTDTFEGAKIYEEAMWWDMPNIVRRPRMSIL